VCVCVCVCVSLCVLLLFFSDCRIYLFSSLAARVFNKLTRYLEGAFVPPGWGELMLTYSRLTSVSTQPGRMPTMVFSGNVLSTWQHSIRGRWKPRVTAYELEKSFSFNNSLEFSGYVRSATDV